MARRNADLLAGQRCELRLGRDVFELSGDGSKLSITAGTARAPDAVIALDTVRHVGDQVAVVIAEPQAQAREVDAEERAEREKEEAATPLVAPGLRLPNYCDIV